MNIVTISTENDEYQIIQSLKTNRVKRAKNGEIFIEGIESIKQALAAGVKVTRLITSDVASLSGWAREVTAQHSDARLIELSRPLYEKVCDRAEPAELLVTAVFQHVRIQDIPMPKKPFVLLFDRPSDQGNFGSIVRSANSFGVDAVLIIGHGIDCYDPKSIRSSLGSVFHTKIAHIQSMQELMDWKKTQKKLNGMEFVGTDSTGEVSLIEHKLDRPICLILGNEAKGMSVALKECCDYILRIPLCGNVNSLNVSCAGSILLWEVFKNSH
ncbi:MAG: RNA methyltransferase [Spirochaetales bacterium]|nr:RNA methyltransferase [Spirochaetales bacterium]